MDKMELPPSTLWKNQKNDPWPTPVLHRRIPIIFNTQRVAETTAPSQATSNFRPSKIDTISFS